MKHKVRVALSLSWAERILLGQAWIRLLWVGLALRILPLPKVQALLVGRSHRNVRSSFPPSRLAFLVDAAARHHLLALHCLQRSLVLQSFLRAEGKEADLRIGVRRGRQRIEAHAWVEQDGQVIGDSPELVQRYLSLYAGG